jgi:hypothetical protein
LKLTHTQEPLGASERRGRDGFTGENCTEDGDCRDTLIALRHGQFAPHRVIASCVTAATVEAEPCHIAVEAELHNVTIEAEE